MSSITVRARRLLWPDGRKARALRLAAIALPTAAAMAVAIAAAIWIRAELLTPCSVYQGEPERLPVSFTGAPSPEQQDFVREYYKDLQIARPRWVADLTYPFDPKGAGRLVRTFGQAAKGPSTAAFGSPEGSHVAVCMTFPASRVRHLLSIHRPMPGSPWAIDTGRTLHEISRGCEAARA